VTVTFAPLAPGVRLGAVELNVSSGPSIPATPIYGIGVGPALAFTPGIINTVAGGGSWLRRSKRLRGRWLPGHQRQPP
jgi:hypothetical protein